MTSPTKDTNAVYPTDSAKLAESLGYTGQATPEVDPTRVESLQAMETGRGPLLPAWYPSANELNDVADASISVQEVGSPNTPLPVVYGRDKVKGRLAVVAIDETNGLMYLAVAFATPCEAIEALYVDGVEVNGIGGLVEGGGVVELYPQGGVSPLLVAAIAQGYADSPAACYAALQIPSTYCQGFPQVEAIIKGKRVYDPRTSSVAYSTNPALCFADLCEGAGWSVNSTWLTTAANYCDESLNGVPRHTIGLALVDPRPIGDWARVFRVYTGCFIIWDAGQVCLIPDKAASLPGDLAMALTTDDILAESLSLSKRGEKSRPTQIVVEYRDCTDPNNWRSARAVYPETVAEELRVSRVSLPGLHDYAEAYREAKMRYNRLALDTTLQLTLFDAGLKLLPGSVVSVTHPLGLSGAYFRVVDLTMDQQRWRLTLEPYSDIYSSDTPNPAPYPLTPLGTPGTGGGGGGYEPPEVPGGGGSGGGYTPVECESDLLFLVRYDPTTNRAKDFTPNQRQVIEVDTPRIFGGGPPKFDTGGATYAGFKNLRSTGNTSGMTLMVPRPAIDIDDHTFTLEFWIRFDATTSDWWEGNPSDTNTAGDYGIFWCYEDDTNCIALGWRNQDRQADNNAESGDYNQICLFKHKSRDEITKLCNYRFMSHTGTWLHFALRRAAAEEWVRFYINGVDVSGKKDWTFNGHLRENNQSCRMYFCGDMYQEEATGLYVPSPNYIIDDARLWRQRREVADIIAYKDAELTGTEPYLIGYWKFNDGPGSTRARDYSPTGLNLTVRPTRLGITGQNSVFVTGATNTTGAVKGPPVGSYGTAAEFSYPQLHYIKLPLNFLEESRLRLPITFEGHWRFNTPGGADGQPYYSNGPDGYGRVLFYIKPDIDASTATWPKYQEGHTGAYNVSYVPGYLRVSAHFNESASTTTIKIFGVASDSWQQDPSHDRYYELASANVFSSWELDEFAHVALVIEEETAGSNGGTLFWHLYVNGTEVTLTPSETLDANSAYPLTQEWLAGTDANGRALSIFLAASESDEE